jgi:hypothetical protein
MSPLRLSVSLRWENPKGQSTKKEALQKELTKGGGLERLRDMLLAESTLDYLIEKTGVSKKLSVED